MSDRPRPPWRRMTAAFVASPTGGPAPVKLSGTIAPGGGVGSFTFGWSPLSN